MKLMTLNTHSLVEPDCEEKLKLFAEVIKEEKPDILALQEVSQTAGVVSLSEIDPPNFTRCEGFHVAVRSDNYAERLARLLENSGEKYYWSWVSAKLGYEKYDEGIAIFSRKPICEAKDCLISESGDYSNWKTRRALGIRTEGSSDWFYTVHMGWWKDQEEPFDRQWKRLEEFVRKNSGGGNCWLLGDFNSQDTVRDEGYDLVCASGWNDTYILAEKKDSGFTVEEEIDGWRDGDPGCDESQRRKRLDYIFCSEKKNILTSDVICNGKDHPVVSDHYGVRITTA